MLDVADKENVYVFSKSQGTMNVDENNKQKITATYNKDIFTYQLDSNVYFMYFVQDGENFYYTGVFTENIKDSADQRGGDASYGAKERAVYTAMSALYGAITEYRDDYFAKNPEEA